jgi:DNA-binding transcriptional MerR regulator
MDLEQLDAASTPERLDGATSSPRTGAASPVVAASAPARARSVSKALSRQEAPADGRAETRVSAAPVVPVSALPPIPAKRYFTIGEVSDLCGVKPYVLRYWEQEFTQLRPMKRRGNRRYYQHHEVLLVRRIRELLYEQGFTISGARNQLSDQAGTSASASKPAVVAQDSAVDAAPWGGADLAVIAKQHPEAAADLRAALVAIRDLLV